MTLLKKSNFPSLLNERWMTDFFENGRFFDSDWMKMNALPPVPAVNVIEAEKEFVIELAAPGLTKKDFNLEVENGVLTISVEKKSEKEETDKNFTRKEFNYSNFTRSFTLPENVNDEKIIAHYEEGILKLHIAKKVLTKANPKKEIAVV
jgi:HSP20 family protein